MDQEVQRIVDAEWAQRFGLPHEALRSGTVHVLTAEVGANDAMSFLLEDTCVVLVRPDDFEAARSALSGLDASAAFTADMLRTVLRSDARVDGPSWHSYVSQRTFRGGIDPTVEPIGGRDPALLSFLEENDIDEWAESGFPLDPAAADDGTTRFWVVRDDRQILSAGNMTEWRGLPADVGLLTHPGARGRGLATRVAATMVAEMLPTIGMARYRALATNRPSLAVALGLGFEPYGQNYRARRRRS